MRMFKIDDVGIDTIVLLVEISGTRTLKLDEVAINL